MYVTNINNNTKQSYNFHQTSSNRNWDEFMRRWKNGEFSWDNLTEEERQYIKAHDPLYASLFV